MSIFEWIVVICLIIIAFGQISFLYSEHFEPDPDQMHHQKMSVLNSINLKLEVIQNQVLNSINIKLEEIENHLDKKNIS